MAKKQTKKSTASTRPASKRKTAVKKLESIEQVNGKIESAVSAAQDLDKILGVRQKNPFGTSSSAEFAQSLSSMNLTDMREMAVTAGIFPSGNRTILKKKLIKGFDSFSKGFENSKPVIPVNGSAHLPDSETQKKIDEIWSKK